MNFNCFINTLTKLSNKLNQTRKKASKATSGLFQATNGHFHFQRVLLATLHKKQSLHVTPSTTETIINLSSLRFLLDTLN